MSYILQSVTFQLFPRTQFTVRGTAAEYLPDGPWGFDSVDYTDHINGISVRNYEDHANNQLVFEVNSSFDVNINCPKLLPHKIRAVLVIKVYEMKSVNFKFVEM